MTDAAKPGFRIVSWNLNGNNRSANEMAWRYLVEELDADVALVQEAQAPPGWDAHIVPVQQGGTTRRWGTGVAIRKGKLHLLEDWPLPEGSVHPGPHPGSAVGATVELDGVGSLAFVSVHNIVVEGAAYRGMHSILNDVVGIVDRRRRYAAVVVGGDINTGDQLPMENTDFPRYRNLVERFGAIGLHDLLDATADRREPLHGCECRRSTCRHVRTQALRKPGSSPWQTDYLWATEPLAPHLISCWVDEREAATELSDHLPVVADFGLVGGLAPAPTRRAGDESKLLQAAAESGVGDVFRAAIDIAERHGLGRRTFSDSLMLTPRAHWGRMLMTLWLHGRNVIRLATAAEALEAFYGVPEAVSLEAFGSFGVHLVAAPEALRFIETLDGLLAEASPPAT